MSNWRSEIQADLVAQLVGFGTGGTCGIAWIPPSEDFLSDRSLLLQRTYSVSALFSGFEACPSNVLAHEMGHNLSLNHDRETIGFTPSSVLPYGFGHKVSSGRGSLMSYPDLGFDGYVPFLSNPDITIDGEPLGVPVGEVNEAYAALAVAQVAPYYEAIFDNGAGGDLLIPLPPILTGLTSGISTIDISFFGYRHYGQPFPPLFTATCGDKTASGPSSPLTLEGLSPGTSYKCSVTATNEWGTSVASSSDTIATLTTYVVTPFADNGGAISPATAQTVVESSAINFTVTPDSDFVISSVSGCAGSLAGRRYTTGSITSDCTVTATFSPARTITGLAKQITFDNLPTGETYACSTIATNLAGSSLPSNVVRFTTQAPSAPSMPIITRTDYDDSELTLFVSVTNNGGVPITEYRANCSGIEAVSSTSTILVSGLTNGVEYQCSVTAVNASNLESTSSTSVAITPEEFTPSGLPVWLLYEAAKN